MAGTAGSIRKVTLDGITFDTLADTNITEMGSQYEVEGIPTSGGNIKKMTRRVETRESVIIACDGAERDILKGLAERIEDYPMSYETAAGDVYRSPGYIEFVSRETEENRAEITMIPRETWDSFLAS